MANIVSIPDWLSNTPSSVNIGCTISGAASKCNQKATSELLLIRFVSEESHTIAIKKVTIPKSKMR